MTVQQIIDAKDNPPRTAKQLKAMLNRTKFGFIKSDVRGEPHLISSHYQLDEFNNPAIYQAHTISNAYSQLKGLAIAIQKRGACSLENLYRGFHLLNYEQMCSALNLTPESRESKVVWKNCLEADRALRNFYQSELEAIALYFHKLKETDSRYR